MTSDRYAPPNPTSHEDLIDRLDEAPLRVVRRFLAKRVRPAYPRFLYKYRGPVKEHNDHVRDLLVESRLWLSSPRDFNDPFDMTAYLSIDADTSTIRERMRRLVEIHGKQQGLLWKERQKKLNELMGRSRADMLGSLRRVHEENIKRCGVYSFAGDPRHILMWSHYARDHTGICVQFEVARSPKVLLGAISVKYVEEYPSYNWATDEGEQMQAVLLHKYVAWSYEKERRIIWPEGAHSFVRLKPAAITSVIVGCRAAPDAIDNLKRVLEERMLRGLPAVRTFVARQHPRKYSVTIHQTLLM